MITINNNEDVCGYYILFRLKISDNQTVCKEFDSIIKGYVVALSGSPATTRLQLPKSPKKQR